MGGRISMQHYNINKMSKAEVWCGSTLKWEEGGIALDLRNWDGGANSVLCGKKM